MARPYSDYLKVNENFVPSCVNKRKGTTGSVIIRTKIPFLNYFFQKSAYWARRSEAIYSFLDRMGVRSLRLKLMRANQEKIFKNGLSPSSLNLLEPGVRRKLNLIYKSDIEKLEKLSNKSLNGWKK